MTEDELKEAVETAKKLVEYCKVPLHDVAYTQQLALICLAERLRLAEAVIGPASELLEDHLDDYGFGSMENWEEARKQWPGDCPPIRLGDALKAWREGK